MKEWGIALLIIGIIFALISVTLIIIYYNRTKPWFIWVTVFLSVAFVIIGSILLYLYYHSYDYYSTITETF